MVDEPAVLTVTSRAPRPWLAAVLSFAFPGLGQAYAGRPRAALLFAVPVLFLALAIAGLLLAPDADRNRLFSPGFLVGVMVLNGLLLLWRLAAIVHAGLAVPDQASADSRRTATATVAGLVVMSIAMHVWVGVVAAQLEQTLAQVFAPEADRQPPQAPGGGTDGGPTPPPSAPNRWTRSEPVNLLLLGIDAAPGRESAQPDVILVLSVRPADGSAVLISVPRDTGWVPLPDDRLYPDGLYPRKVNQLAAEAAASPSRWCPDRPGIAAAACGRLTLERSIGLYLGIEIHHYATVDMAGFAEMIDAVGGLQLCLPGRLVDPEFDGSLENVGEGEPLVLPAGCHHYSGLEALAYARSRQGWIELADGTRLTQTDFDRNERQQEVLLALRRELAEADTLFELPGLIGAIGRTVSTDVPREQAGDMAALLPLVTGPDIDRIVLGHPEFVDLPVEPEVNYLLVPRRDAIRAAMAALFGTDELEGWYLAGRAPAAPGAPIDEPGAP